MEIGERKSRIFTALAIVGVLALTGCSQDYGEYEMTGAQLQSSNGISEEQTSYNDTAQLTEEDIQQMNDGQALIVYGNEGFVTTLVGKYCNDVIKDYEDAVASLYGVARLIGLSAGSEFFCVYGETDNDGYTYYTFQQRYGGLTLQYATLRVIVDPSGYTAGLSSSFTPNAGIAEDESSITAAQAESAVRSKYSGTDFSVYTDYTQKIALTIENVIVNCYAVYTSNPDVSAEFDMMYIEHFVAYSGEYLMSIPTASLDTSTENAYKADQYFDDLTAMSYTGKVTLYDGTEKDITVPVLYDSEAGRYYLGDAKRKIMVADYYDFNYNNSKLSFISDITNENWKNEYLIAYYNYIKSYDFYADNGIQSVDGFGTPILITVDWCDENRKPVNNACYYGIRSGWACFGVSSANNYSESLDVTSHEFTHGVTRSSMGGSVYANETGAINESFSDIMGNLIEMQSGATSDGTWKMGETSGNCVRSMSSPGSFGQPEFVGDIGYIPCVAVPDYNVNDCGGVHSNNSLASMVAYRLYADGMSLSQESSLWITSMELMTPYADYDDLYACLVFSARINGLESYTDTLTSAFKDIGLTGDRSANALSASREGCGRISFDISSELSQGVNRIEYFSTADNSFVSWTAPDDNGHVSAMLPDGDYAVVFYYVTADGSVSYYYKNGKWSEENTCSAVTVENGQNVEIADI